MSIKIFLICIFTSLILGCEKYVEKDSPEYINEINSWHHKRIENLKEENGWLNLVGLYFLKEGINSFGSGKDNDLILDASELPSKVCIFVLRDTVVEMIADENVELFVNGKIVKRIFLNHDLNGNPTIVSYKNYRFFIIKRGNKYALRVRNLEAPLVKEFKSIDRFPINDDWRIVADFIPYNPPKEILIPSIIGIPTVEFSTGKAIFNIDGKNFELDALKSGDGLFFVFADETNGKETYGAGRFLIAEKPDRNGKIILDFNKSFNPPCAFTKYATCPLPPPQNFLKIRIEAGEKSYRNHK